MLNVFLTVDVEIWPSGWDLNPGNFHRYFDRYINGVTTDGAYGLPYQLHLAKKYDLRLVCFVEPLFAYEFGLEPLCEIVDMIQEAGQEVQLHLHTEWVGKMTDSLLPGRSGILLRDYSEDEQAFLIGEGMGKLTSAGAKNIVAFRAGSFGANRATLTALTRNGIFIDSSYNLTTRHGPMLEGSLFQPQFIDGIKEFPLTVYQDWPGHYRQAQIAASSFHELHRVLLQAYRRNWHSFVILSHSAELLDGSRSHCDRFAIKRFEKLCRFLANNQDKFQTRWFSEMNDQELPSHVEPAPLTSSPVATGLRYAEQLARRLVVT